MLVPVGSMDSLADAMEQMLADSCRAEAMGEKAMAVRQKLHVDGIGRQWMDYLSGIAGRN